MDVMAMHGTSVLNWNALPDACKVRSSERFIASAATIANRLRKREIKLGC